MNILDKYFKPGSKIHEKLQKVVLSGKQVEKLKEKLAAHDVSIDYLEEFEILAKLLKSRSWATEFPDQVWMDQIKIFQLLTHTDESREDWPVKLEINGQAIEINSDLYRDKVIQILKDGFQEEFKRKNFNLPEFRFLMDKIYDNTGKVRSWITKPGPKDLDLTLQAYIGVIYVFLTEQNIPKFQNHRRQLISELCKINDIKISADSIRILLRQMKLCK